MHCFKKSEKNWPSKREPSETAPLLSEPAAEGRQQRDGRHDGHHVSAKKSHSIWEVFSPQSSINLVAYTLLALHSVAFDQLLPIFMHHPRQQRDGNEQVQLPLKFAGGFGVGSGQIGLLFTLYGIIAMFIQFLVFPPLARRLGILPCLKASAIAFPIIYLLTPFTALFESGLVQQGAMFVLMAGKGMAVVFAFPCCVILLTNSAVSLQILGTLNGVATSISALGRAVGPAIGGATFTWGVDVGYVVLPWWTLSFLAALGCIPIWFLEEKEGSNLSGDDGGEEGTAQNDAHRRNAISSPIGIGGHVLPSARARGSTPTLREILGSSLGQSNNGYGLGGTSYQ